MPPKLDLSDPKVASLISLFNSIGLSDTLAQDTVRNSKIAPILESTIKDADAENGCDKATGNLLYALATGLPKDAKPLHRSYIAKAIAGGKLKSSEQVTAAVKYVSKVTGEINEIEFDKETGVGIVMTPEDIKQGVASYILDNKATLLEERYKKLGPTLSALRSYGNLRWANALDVKAEVERQFLELLGPKDERDAPQKKKKEPAAQKKPAAGLEQPKELPVTNMFEEGWLSRLHKPGTNPQIKPELMEEHLKFTAGKVFTRFPPEPNGFLHIGHAKSIAINFGFAKFHGGNCYLRYDDTNPEAEEQKFFDAILDIVTWLGFKPWKITHASDNFDRLYELAVKLIRDGKGYVCHCTGEEIKAARGEKSGALPKPCIHRERPVEESLAEFEKMKVGKYKANEAVLRMKQDLTDPNPQMWDLVAYRIIYAPHHRTGDKWCIYPTYDFTHCLCDSFENITHSLCTTEFILSNQSYRWLCDALEVYKPVQSEFGRLNLTGTVLSKRKLLQLIKEKHVQDWDDPRLYTMVAIRRRGIPPSVLLSFVNELGVTTAITNINIARFEHAVRKNLEDTVPRLMMVENPVKVVITNLGEDYYEECHAPFKPKDPSGPGRKLPFTRYVYIDESDFREVDSKDYFRMAPGKAVGLLYVPRPVICTSYKKDPTTGKVIEIECELAAPDVKKPKTYIQWVGDTTHLAAGANHLKSPIRLREVRNFEPLFKSENPSAVEAGYLTDINPDSLKVSKSAVMEVGLEQIIKDTTSGAPEEMRFQALRIAYFCIDRESDMAKKEYVLNRIVTLREDNAK